MSEIKLCGHGLLADCCVDCFRARVAELERENSALESCQRARRAAEARVAELEKERDNLWTKRGAAQIRTQMVEKKLTAAESRVKRLEGALRMYRVEHREDCLCLACIEALAALAALAASDSEVSHG